jgi:ABC-type sugar transport system ATPase subunit
MTVQENLSFALKLRKIPKDEIARRTAAAAETLGLTPYLKRLPKALSGGQRQRVALGRAIVRNPSVFLFDEPLSNLDAKMRVEMRAEIIRLHRRLGATMIYVTHDQTEAMTMGTRIVVMNGGRIQQAAPPMEVYERPSNTFVASFIGTPPMNLFPPGILDLGRTAGVRPENIRISCDSQDGGRGISAVVDLIEPLGSETLVHCITELRNIRVTVRVQNDGSFPIRQIKHSDRIVLLPDMDRVIVFDREGV